MLNEDECQKSVEKNFRYCFEFHNPISLLIKSLLPEEIDFIISHFCTCRTSVTLAL